MERDQESEWREAQSIEINVDLASAAKRQLKFLAAVDRNRWLYEGPGLAKAIYRYNVCWLPLLAKHSEFQLCEGPLVVPLDCEWIWHCHRLNPVRYKQDCEELYGKILDNKNVISSLKGIPSKTTEKIWKTLYPDEPYRLDMETALQDDMSRQMVKGGKCTKYDLISAVKRQSPFFYQVSRPYMTHARYIEGAVARYKGFLYLIKRNIEKSIKSFSVPTYDIDLIWHTHQLHPVAYCNDLLKIMGKILEHDDTDSDRSKGQKLDVGFSGTTKTFEEMYGYRYWRAGAMYRGSAPSPVRTTSYPGIVTKKVLANNENPKITVPMVETLEVMLEIVGLRNVPEGHKGNLLVTFSKSQPDLIFNVKRTLKIFSESGEKQVASFQCQPNGYLHLELLSSPSSLPLSKSSKTIGTSSISLEDILSSNSNLIVEKWLDLAAPASKVVGYKPIGLRIGLSVTVPSTALYVVDMIQSRPFLKRACSFPMRVHFRKSQTLIIDEDGNVVLRLQMRDSKKSRAKQEQRGRVVIGVLESGETFNLAEFVDSQWAMVNSPWSLKLPNANNDDGHLFELTGPHTVRLFPGGRLDYEPRQCEKHKLEHKLEPHHVTAVEFSAEDPYGKAVAFLDLKSGSVKVKEEWFLFPAFILAFILGDIVKKEGYDSLIAGSKIMKQKEQENETTNDRVVEGSDVASRVAPAHKEMQANVEVGKVNRLMLAKGGGCSGGCGNDARTEASRGCGDTGGNDESDVGIMESAKCGGCGGGGGCGGSGNCGNMARCGGGGCGGKCGGGTGSNGCGNMARCGGGGCGGKCGGGGCGGGGCGNMASCGDGCGCGGGGN